MDLTNGSTACRHLFKKIFITLIMSRLSQGSSKIFVQSEYRGVAFVLDRGVLLINS